MPLKDQLIEPSPNAGPEYRQFFTPKYACYTPKQYFLNNKCSTIIWCGFKLAYENHVFNNMNSC